MYFYLIPTNQRESENRGNLLLDGMNGQLFEVVLFSTQKGEKISDVLEIESFEPGFAYLVNGTNECSLRLLAENFPIVYEKGEMKKGVTH